MANMFNYKEIANGLKKGYQDMLFNGDYVNPSETDVNEMELSSYFADMVNMGKNAIVYYLKEIIYSRLLKDEEDEYYPNVANERRIGRLVKFACVIDEEFYNKISSEINAYVKGIKESEEIEEESFEENEDIEFDDNTGTLIHDFIFNEMVDNDFVTLLDYLNEDISCSSDEWNNLEDILMNINDTLEVLELYVNDDNAYEKIDKTLLKTASFDKVYENCKSFLISEGEHVTTIEDIDGLDMYRISLESDERSDQNFDIETESSYLVYDNEFKQFFVEQNVYDNKNDVEYKIECGYDEEGDEIIFNIYKNLEAVCEIGTSTKGMLLGDFIPYFNQSAEDGEEAKLFAIFYLKAHLLLLSADEEMKSIGLGSIEDFGIII